MKKSDVYIYNENLLDADIQRQIYDDGWRMGADWGYDNGYVRGYEDGELLGKQLENNKDYETALDYIEFLMEESESKEINRKIELITSLITIYEDKHFPIDLPDLMINNGD